MAEQADSLRRWMQEQALDVTLKVLGTRTDGPHVLAVTSGKGGVGKSNLALNLGLALVERGARVAVLDADLGLANISIILGQETDRTVWDVIQGDSRLRDIMAPGPLGIQIIPGASGLAEAAAADLAHVVRLIDDFQALDDLVDWLIVDTGAGISPTVLAFVAAADSAVVVTTPEPTALADAYGLIKAVHEEESPVRLQLVVNRASDPAKGQKIGERLAQLADKALGRAVDVLGVIAEDAGVGRAVVRQQPFYLNLPRTAAGHDVGRLADRLLGRVPAPRRGGLKDFMRRVFTGMQRDAVLDSTGGDSQ